jgi:hypothetical protein
MFNTNKELVNIMNSLLELHQTWTERMLSLEEEKVRLERLRLEGATNTVDAPMGQLRISEDEQDADWALRHNLISPGEYKDLLEKTGLSATDIEFL